MKDQLSTLLERVGHGEHITITQDGKPVAKLVPVPADADQEDVRRAMEIHFTH